MYKSEQQKLEKCPISKATVIKINIFLQSLRNSESFFTTDMKF